MHQDQYIARHYERIFQMRGIAAVYRLPHPTLPAPAVLELEVTVALGSTTAEREVDSVTIESRIEDILIAAVDLVHEGVLIKPSQTHRIIIPTQIPWAENRIMRPAPPAEGSPVWRWSDPAQTIMRIHTRKDAADALQPPYGGAS